MRGSEEEAVELGRDRPPFDVSQVPPHRWFLAITLVLLNVLDVGLTKWIIHLGGQEANPFLKPIIDDPAAPLLLKVLMATFIGVLLVMSPAHRRFVDRATALVCVIYTVVIGWNISVLIQAAQSR